jgi:hypothetical protein
VKHKLSKWSQTLVNKFGDAAENHGWQEDQGSGRDVDDGRENNDACKAALERRIARLEAKIAKLQTPPPTPVAEYHPNWESAGGTTCEQNDAHFSRG